MSDRLPDKPATNSPALLGNGQHATADESGQADTPTPLTMQSAINALQALRQAASQQHKARRPSNVFTGVQIAGARPETPTAEARKAGNRPAKALVGLRDRAVMLAAANGSAGIAPPAPANARAVSEPKPAGTPLLLSAADEVTVDTPTSKPALGGENIPDGVATTPTTSDGAAGSGTHAEAAVTDRMTAGTEAAARGAYNGHDAKVKRSWASHLVAGVVVLTLSCAVAIGSASSYILFADTAAVTQLLVLPIAETPDISVIIRLHALLAVAWTPALIFAGLRRDHFFPEASAVFAFVCLVAGASAVATFGIEALSATPAGIYVGLLLLQALLPLGFLFKTIKANVHRPARVNSAPNFAATADSGEMAPARDSPVTVAPAPPRRPGSLTTKPRPAPRSSHQASLAGAMTGASTANDVMAFVKQCPQCGEFIRRAAKKCRHCGFHYTDELLAKERKLFQAQEQ